MDLNLVRPPKMLYHPIRYADLCPIIWIYITDIFFNDKA